MNRNPARLILLLSLLVLSSALLLAGCGGDEGGGDEQQGTAVTYEQLNQWLGDKEEMTIVDVRTPVEWQAGHLQDAVNIELTTFVDNDGSLANGGKALTDVVQDKGRRIIAYCFGYGKDATFARAARELGYTSVLEYTGGTEDWSGTHKDYLVIEYEAFKANHHPVPQGEYLVDVLPVDWYTGDDLEHPGGHIPGAISIPSTEWANNDGTPKEDARAFTSVVTDKDSVLIVYCGDWQCGKSLIAAKAAVSLGHTKVYRYQGGWKEWQDKGNDLKPGTEP